MVSAQSDSVGSGTLVDKIASTFHLNKSDVQKVFDENRQAHEAEHKAQVEKRLQAMVDKGTITSDQKSAIIAKLDELRTQHEQDKGTLKNLTPAERKAKFDKQKSELESWAKDQGLDLSKLKGIFMGPGHRGPYGPRQEAGQNS